MSSPFKTPQEFLEVKGPLYTFANSSFWLTFFLVFTVIIFLWFIYASYKIKANEPSKSDPAVMSVLILTGFISLAQSAYISGTTAIEAYRQNKFRVSLQNRTLRKVTRSNTRQDYLSRSPERYAARSRKDRTTYRG